MSASRPNLADLADAIARGRLAPAELALIPPRELDAMAELAAQCIDAGRNAAATTVLAGLVALFPYSARYWRTYGVALHRQPDFRRALTAYEAALTLEPGHPLTRCYRVELLIRMDRMEVARCELDDLVRTADPAINTRVRELSLALDEMQQRGSAHAEESPASVTDGPNAETARFTLDGNRELPLRQTRFVESEETLTLAPEVTATARIYADLADETTATNLSRPTRPESTVTGTAVIRRRQHRLLTDDNDNRGAG